MRRPDMRTPEQNQPPATPAEELPVPMRPRRPEDFDASYAGTPPWDIGRPQPAFLALAEAGTIRGRVLDVGCGPASTLSWPPAWDWRRLASIRLRPQSLLPKPKPATAA